MMKIILKLLIFCLILGTYLTCFTGCSNNLPYNNSKTNATKSYKYFIIPDYIVIYNNGKEKKITNKDPLLSKILDLTNDRFTNKIDYYKLVVEMSNLNKLEKQELVLEFVYYETKETIYDEKQNYSRKYKKLIMPLTGEYTNCIFFDTGSETSFGPISTLASPEQLIKILK